MPAIVHGEHGTIHASSRQRFIQRHLWPRLDAIASVSSRLTERLAATIGFPQERIVTIRNGVDVIRFSPDRREAARRLFAYDPDTIVVGAVGRLNPVKDHQSFLQAVLACRRQGLMFKTVLAGDGPLREQLEGFLRDHRLGDHVTLLGNRSDVENVLASLDLFVQSSVSEGLSNTVLEAMASGVPVIATNVGGTDELVSNGETGLLVPASDAGSLSAAICSLALDAARRKAMAQASRLRAVEQFSIAQMIKGYEDLYDAVAHRLGPRRFGRSD